jgi:D-ribose pyranose/furanose isomerase RbsD
MTTTIKEYQDFINNYSIELKRFLNGLADVVSEEYLEQVILARAIEEQEEMNRQQIASWWVEFLSEELQELDLNHDTMEDIEEELTTRLSRVEF